MYALTSCYIPDNFEKNTRNKFTIYHTIYSPSQNMKLGQPDEHKFISLQESKLKVSHHNINYLLQSNIYSFNFKLELYS